MLHEIKAGAGHRPFFVDGEADADKNGIVTISEVHDFLYRAVPEATAGAQHPELKGDFANTLPVAVTRSSESGAYAAALSSSGVSATDRPQTEGSASADVRRAETVPTEGERNLTPAWIGGGVAILGAGMGTLFATMKSGADSTAESIGGEIRSKAARDPASVCAAGGGQQGGLNYTSSCNSLADAQASADRNATLMYVSFVTSGAAAAFSIGWLLFAPRSAPTTKASLVPMMDGGALGLNVRGLF